MPDDPSAYGSYMNFFLPQSARVGNPNLPVPGLYDMLGNMGRPNVGETPEEQRKKEQEQRKQGLALGQQGLKMMSPEQPPQFMPPASAGAGVQTAATPLMQPQPPANQEPPPQPRYDPRDPRRRNPIAGMPTPFGGVYR